MAKSEFMTALMQLAAEKNLPKEIVLSALESAMVSAYRKDAYTHGEELSVRINPATGEVKLIIKKVVTESPEDTYREISLKDAKKIDGTLGVGDVVTLDTPPPDAGRIPAQIAKQVILQKLHDAERGAIYEEFAGKEGEIITGTVQKVTTEHVIVDIGKTEAIIPNNEKVPTERYRPGQRVKLYIVEVARTSRGPQIIASRAHRNLLRDLLILEIPEIASGVVEIKAVTREAGYRSKVAVTTRQPGIDPVGCCVGLRGIRIQNIVNELNGEKIDVIQWSEDPKIFIANSLSPAQVLSVTLDEKESTALVKVSDKHLSLAIGKEGQNVRLAAKLTGWRIDIKSASELEPKQAAPKAEAAPAEAERPEEVKRVVAKPGEPEKAAVATEEKAAIEETVQAQPVGIAIGSAEADRGPVIEITLPQETAVTERTPSKIRFAEDILSDRGGKSKRKELAKKDETKDSAGKVKKAKHKKTDYFVDEDFEV